ncbi:hypothetical protein JCM14469_33890 [Desulfatiferula olefinivorans]
MQTNKPLVFFRHAAPWVILMILTGLITACGSKQTAPSPSAFLERSKYARYDEAQSVAEPEPIPAPSDTNLSLEPSKAAARKVHYNGYARMRSPRPDALIDQARERVVASGGYVERISEGNAVFRVPVRSFQTVFNAILALGEVQARHVSARDVTDAYTDMTLQLSIAKAARNRYLELLNQAADEEEKLSLLNEIARLNERIEAMERRLKTLTTLADFSRISLDVTGIDMGLSSGDTEDVFEFRWIHSLSPFSRACLESGRTLSFETPAGMVALGGPAWITESAEGVVLSAHRRDNRPSGDTAFWVRAVANRLEKGFASMTEKTAGDFTLLRMESLSEPSYVYVVGLRAADKTLQVIEIYYPDEDLETRHGAAILDTLVTGVK